MSCPLTLASTVKANGWAELHFRRLKDFVFNSEIQDCHCGNKYLSLKTIKISTKHNPLKLYVPVYFCGNSVMEAIKVKYRSMTMSF